MSTTCSMSPFPSVAFQTELPNQSFTTAEKATRCSTMLRAMPKELASFLKATHSQEAAISHKNFNKSKLDFARFTGLEPSSPSKDRVHQVSHMYRTCITPLITRCHTMSHKGLRFLCSEVHRPGIELRSLKALEVPLQFESEHHWATVAWMDIQTLAP